MPCQDLSEIVEISFDGEERLTCFELRKATCGAPVGLPSLEPLAGLTIDELRREALPRLLRRTGGTLLLRQRLDALARALAVLTGDAAGGPGQPLAVERIEHDERGTRLTGVLAVDLPVGDSSPCGPVCAGCGRGSG